MKRALALAILLALLLPAAALALTGQSYATFDESQPFDLEGPNFTLNISVRTINGGVDGALATWTYDEINYSFYSPDPTDYEEITDVLLPILYVDFPFVDCCG